MLRIDKFIYPNSKVIRTPEGQLILDVIKKYPYGNPNNLLLSWWDRNIFYKPYSISNDEKPTIWSDFGESGSYGSMCLANFIGKNTYTGNSIVKRANVNQIQGTSPKNDINFNYKIYSFNVIP